ncbi:MAG TPA: hypothetical protein VHG09_06710 [Longimicrobiales bacterium]|nr:hypothetical protein [Longimicrobiales bacterium]
MTATLTTREGTPMQWRGCFERLPLYEAEVLSAWCTPYTVGDPALLDLRSVSTRERLQAGDLQ